MNIVVDDLIIATHEQALKMGFFYADIIFSYLLNVVFFDWIP